MKKVFDKDYAYFYDIFYRRKNYKKECEFLETIFKKFSKNKPRQILDIACGTGGHANILAKKGYSLTGIDASKYMLERARNKAKKQFLNIRYYQMRMENFNFTKKFDTIISMFSTIDYLTDCSVLEKFLKNVCKYLKRDALFIFDFWNGQATLRRYSPYKKKVIHQGNFIIKRVSQSTLIQKENLCKVNYTINIYEGKKKKKKSFKETHLIRYFFIDELTALLGKCGFKVVGMFPLLNMDREIRQNDWDIVAVTKRLR